jgi:transcriptional regulator of arginine metabolism
VKRRHDAIKRLVRERDLATQEEIAAALQDEGHVVVQTTVSRDIRDLGLVKIRRNGRLVYALPGSHDVEAMRRALRQFALGFEATGNLVVIATPAGAANVLGQVIDDVQHPHVAGTVAGDNTIFVAAREPFTGAELRDELYRLSENQEEGAA